MLSRIRLLPAFFGALAACNSPTAVPDNPDAGPPGADDAGLAGTCDLAAIFNKPTNGCANSGCHGVQYRGSLDLLSPNLGQRLLGQNSAVAACAGRKVIDPAAPDRSLLLTLVDPARFESDGCGVMMPLGGQGVSAEDLRCLEAFVHETAATEIPPPNYRDAFEPSAPEVYANKVKTLLTGGPVTEAELQGLVQNPETFPALVEAWMAEPQFEAKMRAFLTTALQQDAVGELREGLGFPANRPVVNPVFLENLESSFARTAWRIIQEGRPFTEILTTDRWEVTTALLVLLTYADQNAEELALTHRVVREAPANAPNPLPPDYSVENRVWILPGLPEDCVLRPLASSPFLRALFGRLQCRGMPDYRYPGLVTAADMADWRTVRFTAARNRAAVPRFYDLDRLRGVTEQMPLSIQRRGFFTTPIFLDNWQTNEDNQFRVTTNQTLIAALHQTVTISDPTQPLSLAGLAEEHAAPGTDCYGCHRLLDPMRLYFTKDFNFRYQLTASPSAESPAFALSGHTFQGGGLAEFSEGLASHPKFAAAWVQKLCFYANAHACAENDPEFIRLVRLFTESGYNFKTLLGALMSSPLVTHARFTETYAERPVSVSISRTRHLCAALSARVGDDVCRRNQDILGLIPDDAFARGGVDPVLTAETSAFHVAAVEKLCDALAQQVVGAGRAYAPAQAEAAIRAIVADLMSLPVGHSRHEVAQTVLQSHFNQVRDGGATALVALRSAFMVACMSPDVMAVGF